MFTRPITFDFLRSASLPPIPNISLSAQHFWLPSQYGFGCSKWHRPLTLNGGRNQLRFDHWSWRWFVSSHQLATFSDVAVTIFVIKLNRFAACDRSISHLTQRRLCDVEKMEVFFGSSCSETSAEFELEFQGNVVMTSSTHSTVFRSRRRFVSTAHQFGDVIIS